MEALTVLPDRTLLGKSLAGASEWTPPTHIVHFSPAYLHRVMRRLKDVANTEGDLSASGEQVSP